MQKLSPDQIIDDVNGSITVQEYSGKDRIDGLQIEKITQFAAEDGTFAEILRLDESGSLAAFPEFQVRQVNRSKLLAGAIKGWHLHYNQEDVWYVAPEDHMILGLWDLRKDSPTVNMTMKIPLGAGTSKLVYIPRGVAHGVANIAHVPGVVYYYVNQQFSATEPDEQRLPWDACGADFWEPEKA